MYSIRTRRKPTQRTVKPPMPDGVKSNPSKRHRDRLNLELERLASLLPFPDEVTSNLDKLSILRLSVSYLRAKNFFSVALKSHSCVEGAEGSGGHDNSKATGLAEGILPEGELLLQALNGFVLVVTVEGLIFYSSHTIQDYLGFHQTDVMHQSVFDLIHTEDQLEFRRNLHWALNPTSHSGHSSHGEKTPGPTVVTYSPDQLPPENSSFLERSFVCRLRCLLDNSSGFLALNLQGRLKFLHGQNKQLEDGAPVPPQLALFAIATPLQPPSILEIRTKNMIFRTKHKLDFTPLACDAKGKIVLGYTEAELRMRGTGYQFIHAADMLYCAENHVRMIKTGESGLTVFRLLTKENNWKWVQANARLVYKNGKPDYIIATQRPLADEEGGEHLRKRSMHLPFAFATGEALLYQTSYPIPAFPDPFQPKGKSSKSKKRSHNKPEKEQKNIDPNSLLGAMMRQDESVYVSRPAPEPKYSLNSSFFNERGLSCIPGTEADSWNSFPNGGNRLNQSLVGYGQVDPLLSTLSSLSINNEDNCSNNELFGALENLGLNAEDLELLLLDERMMRIEVDPDYIPSLNDLLTNSEILSYVHDSLVTRNDEGQLGSQQRYTSVDPVKNSSKPTGMYPTLMQDRPPQYFSQQSLKTQQQQQHQLISHLSQEPTMTFQNKKNQQHLQASQGQEVYLNNKQIFQNPQQHSQQPWRQPVLLPDGHPSVALQQSVHWQEQNRPWIRQNLQSSCGLQTPSHHQPTMEPHHQQSGQQLGPSVRAQCELQPPEMYQLPQAEVQLQLQSQCQLKQNINQHPVINGMYKHGPFSQQILTNNQWQDYSSKPVADHLVGLSAHTGGCDIGKEVASQVPSAGVSIAGFHMSGMSNMEFIVNSGTQEDLAPYQAFLSTASYQKQLVPAPVGYEYQPENSLDQFLDISSGQQQIGMDSYGICPPSISKDNTQKRFSQIVNGSMESSCPSKTPSKRPSLINMLYQLALTAFAIVAVQFFGPTLGMEVPIVQSTPVMMERTLGSRVSNEEVSRTRTSSFNLCSCTRLSRTQSRSISLKHLLPIFFLIGRISKQH
ncbi:aryl hydrocarbon receptor 1b [Latimeria chalumnae]|uniref:aryl hydrocarbon receptor 1b n=1 Tax=Latimeria chalumnae TaxID=7897 RepID=UPI00313E6A05